MIGRTLSHYRILEKVGEGGMGVVFKAQDTHLGRFVAIKVLPQSSVADADRKRRFAQEAKAASALNHPNIVTVYDIDDAGGTDFMAMEFVAGKTLDQLIPRHGQRLSDVLSYSVQIADALARAHAAGIIHRDVKPGNIMVTGQGLVKVLDFGLAKLTEISPPGEDAATRTLKPQTEEGAIVGTAAYMSPEQAEGKTVDARSDIFSFGCVLYEMLSGQRAFLGSSRMSVLAAILQKDPRPVREAAASCPAELARVVSRCLRKDPARRFQNMDEVKLALEELKEEPAAELAPPAPVNRTLLPWAAAAALMVAGAVSGFYFGTRIDRPHQAPLRKFQLEIEADMGKADLSDPQVGPVISPDGTMVAYAQQSKLCVHDLNRSRRREIPGAEGAEGSFWSPDSQFIAFWANGVLKKVPARGGQVLTVGELRQANNYIGGTWGSLGTILIAIAGSGLYEVPAGGGEFKLVLAPDPAKAEVDFHCPHYLPDGRSYVYAVHPTTGLQHYLSVRAGERSRRLLEGSSGHVNAAWYAEPGYLLYERMRGGKSVYAVPFSLTKLSVTGEPFVVAEEAGRPTVSRDGTLLYESGAWVRPVEVVMVDRTGKFVRTLAKSHDIIRWPAFSPSGELLALSGLDEGDFDVWVYDLLRQSRIRLTSDPQMEMEAAWSPAGDSLAFTCGLANQLKICRKRSDASGPTLTLTPGGRNVRTPEWSPDGKFLVYTKMGPKGDLDLWMASPDGTEGSRPFFDTPFLGVNPKISPDGRHIAYVSGESGRGEVYVKPFPKGEGRWLVSTNGGVLPRWSRRGDELFYVESNNLMSVPIQVRPAFRAGTPQRLFSGDTAGIWLFSFNTTISAYDVTPDGRHFAAVRPVGGSRNSMVLVQNWLAEFAK